jgi:hypothetical protein
MKEPNPATLMIAPVVEIPAEGSQIVNGDEDVILFGQPPEVLKGPLVNVEQV